MIHKLIWIAAMAAILMGILGLVLMSRIARIHPDLYQELGRPSLLSWYHFAVFGLLRRDRFMALSRPERILALGYLGALLVFGGAGTAALATALLLGQ